MFLGRCGVFGIAPYGGCRDSVCVAVRAVGMLLGKSLSEVVGHLANDLGQLAEVFGQSVG